VIRWDPEVTGHLARSGDAPEPSTIGWLAALDQALADLDATDPENDSIGFDRATDRLLTAVRRALTTAKPILDNLDALEEAVRDAIADRRDLTGWCRECDRSEAGLCGDHAAGAGRGPSRHTGLP
jgi:hypothetical protein